MHHESGKKSGKPGIPWNPGFPGKVSRLFLKSLVWKSMETLENPCFHGKPGVKTPGFSGKPGMLMSIPDLSGKPGKQIFHTKTFSFTFSVYYYDLKENLNKGKITINF